MIFFTLDKLDLRKAKTAIRNLNLMNNLFCIIKEVYRYFSIQFTHADINKSLLICICFIKNSQYSQRISTQLQIDRTENVMSFDTEQDYQANKKHLYYKTRTFRFLPFSQFCFPLDFKP